MSQTTAKKKVLVCIGCGEKFDSPSDLIAKAEANPYTYRMECPKCGKAGSLKTPQEGTKGHQYSGSPKDGDAVYLQQNWNLI